MEVPCRTDRQNQPSLLHQVGCELIPARMENTFDFPGNLKFRCGRDAEALLSVCVWEQAALAEPLSSSVFIL